MTKSILDPDIVKAVESAVQTEGKGKVVRTLLDLVEPHSEEFTLTIIVNAGIHHLAKEYYRGEVFVASYGSLDFSSVDSIHEEFRNVLTRVARKLKEKSWRRIYVIPFGPTPLSMQIKLLVYRICGIESVDVMQVSGGPRVDMEMNFARINIAG